MPTCLACSTTTPELSGRFCPECGAVLAAADPVAETALGSDRNTAAGSLVGDVFDGFHIEGVIGGGAFGTVYRARQVGLDRVVALKVPTQEIASDPVMAKRFAREAKAAARIVHPGVVAIYAVGELRDGRPYLAMQYVEGEPLDAILADGAIPVARGLRLVRQIASALSETHAADVVHRDLKSTNIMWRRDRNGDDRITLVDFGIAVCKPSNADATRLTAGGLIGTPHYMSPEQAHGELVDARADLYALGCLLFELITGTTPFDGSGFEVLLAHLGRQPPRPSERNPDVPEAVDRLVLALMAKRPDDRIQSADELVQRIDDTLDVIDTTEPPDAAAPPRRAKRKTARTRRDRMLTPLPVAPSPGLTQTSPRLAGLAMARGPSRLKWSALGAASALAIATVAFFVLGLGAHGSERIADDGARPVKRVALFTDAGDTRLRVWVPDPLVPGRARVWIDLRNKLGAPISAEHIIVTVEDPDHQATGITARPRQDDPEQYGFAYDFKKPGSYMLRVFPPEDAARTSTTPELALVVK
ncbi:MAG TPA: protein kinase [Kofleriaceae bacterium]|nr:protein kinase [Kofleriaceae bacterium]